MSKLYNTLHLAKNNKQN